MAGITHLPQFKPGATNALVERLDENLTETWLDSVMPVVPTYDRRFAYNIVKKNQFMASYIGYGAEPPIVDRDEVASKMGEIAMFGLKDVVTYEELQAIHEARNDQEQKDVIEKLVIRNVDIYNGMQRIIYAARMEAITKGFHEYTKDKAKIKFEFGIPEENKITLGPADDLDAEGSDVFGSLVDLVDQRIDQHGEFTTMLVSRELAGKMKKHPSFLAEAGKGQGRLSTKELNEVLKDHGLPEVTIVTDRFISYKHHATGEDIRQETLPVNRIVLIAGKVGEYLIGPTLENDFQPGLTVINKDKDEPIRSIMTGYGAGFPTMEKPSGIVHIDAFNATP